MRRRQRNYQKQKKSDLNKFKKRPSASKSYTKKLRRADAHPLSGRDKLTYSAVKGAKEAGNLARAMDIGERALAETPDLPRTLVIMASLEIKRDNHPAAIQYLLRAKEHALDSSIMGRAGEIAVIAGDIDLAIGLFEVAERGGLDKSRTYKYMARAYLQKGDYKKAERAIRHALRIDPQYPAIRKIFIEALYAQGKYTEAIKQIDLIIDTSPRNKPYRQLKAKCLYQLVFANQKDFEACEIFLDDHITYSDVLKLFVLEACKDGEYDLASRVTSYFLRKYPTNLHVAEARLYVMDRKGEKPEETFALATKAINSCRKNPNLFVIRARALSKIRRYGEAIEDVNEAISRGNPAFVLRARINILRRNFSQALADIKIVQSHGKVAIAQTLSAQLLMAQGNYQDAYNTFLRSLETSFDIVTLRAMKVLVAQGYKTDEFIAIVEGGFDGGEISDKERKTLLSSLPTSKELQTHQETTPRDPQIFLPCDLSPDDVVFGKDSDLLAESASNGYSNGTNGTHPNGAPHSKGQKKPTRMKVDPRHAHTAKAGHESR